MPSNRVLRRLRRISQILFLLLFFWLLLATAYHGVSDESTGVTDDLPYPVAIFLQFDPLAALATLLATGGIHSRLLWSLVIVVITLFLGRVFCGWICPMGALHHLATELFPRLSVKKRIGRNAPAGSRSIKYALLVVVLVAALFGTLQTGLLDPLSLLVRSAGLFVLPGLELAARGTVDTVSPTGGVAGMGHNVVSFWFPAARIPLFLGAWLIGGLFIFLIVINRYKPRFFCRVLCPLGALLGLLSRFSLLSIRKETASCKGCGLCRKACQGACAPESGVPWQSAECHLCFNCAADCPRGSLGFGFRIQEEVRDPSVDLSRRGLIASCISGALLFPLARVSLGSPGQPDPHLIRPPGSCEEKEFLRRCIKCGECMKVCPQNAIHPASFQGGIEGIWTPVLIPRRGYCTDSCTLCHQVCPTGAIRAFTMSDKKANKVKIGTAFVDRNLCLPWAQGKPCLVCEEHCPVEPDKAIWFEKRDVVQADGSIKEVLLPRVELERCTGCGICENVCPLKARAAIRITSMGESRSPENQIVL